MSELAFWRAAVQDRSEFLEGILRLLDSNGVQYCAIGGVAVNAYAEPVVTLDLDLVVAEKDVDRVLRLVQCDYRVEEFEHSINVRDPGSRLQLLRLDPEMAGYIERAAVREVLDIQMPVAAPEDLLAAKLRAFGPAGRASKRQKDLTDISRLIEVFPELAERVPPDVLERLVR